MQRTRLYDTHVRMGGRMVDFAGWELPVQYPTGPTVEHNGVRTAAGLFDIDHMGQFQVNGPDAEAYLQLVQVRDVSSIQVYEAHYSLLTYADGTIIDDIFIYRLPDRWMVVVNAGNRAKDLAWMQAYTGGFDVTLEDISEETYMMALQGPNAEQILQPLLGDADLATLQTRTALETTVDRHDALIGRTGYTGEDGFELYVRAADAVKIWDLLLQTGRNEGLLPCGLAARDSLRFEACMPLYGHEIDATINPLEARLGWTISWDREFLGRSALLKTRLEGPQKRLIGFEMVDRAVPRQHHPIAVDGVELGQVTTGMKSPTLNRFLGMGYVPRSHSKLGAEIEILVRGQPKKAVIVRRPFYSSRYK